MCFLFNGLSSGVALLAGVFLISGPAAAAAPETTSAPPQVESRILGQIHAVNQLEIQAGEMAWLKGSTAQVRSYGDRLARDHKKADSMVLGFAKSHNIPIAAPADQQQISQSRQTLDRLSGLKGRAFDLQFLSFMEAGHKAAVGTLGSAEQQLKPGPLRSMVTKMIPILEQHYEIAGTLNIRELGRGGQ